MAGDVESPLAGVAYDGQRGEYEQPGSLERFREPFAAALRAPGG